MGVKCVLLCFRVSVLHRSRSSISLDNQLKRCRAYRETRTSQCHSLPTTLDEKSLCPVRTTLVNGDGESSTNPSTWKIRREKIRTLGDRRDFFQENYRSLYLSRVEVSTLRYEVVFLRETTSLRSVSLPDSSFDVRCPWKDVGGRLGLIRPSVPKIDTYSFWDVDTRGLSRHGNRNVLEIPQPTNLKVLVKLPTPTPSLRLWGLELLPHLLFQTSLTYVEVLYIWEPLGIDSVNSVINVRKGCVSLPSYRPGR